MHVLLWTISGRRFAVPTAQVVEIVPVVHHRSIPHAPPGVRGWINYRGRLILLLDVAVLLGHGETPSRMVNRILVVEYPSQQAGSGNLLGLLVEEVLGSETVDTSKPAPGAHCQLPETPFLGPVLLHESNTIQFVEIARLPVPAIEPAAS
jgi:chemotaxis-related protein WspB